MEKGSGMYRKVAIGEDRFDFDLAREGCRIREVCTKGEPGCH